MIDSWPGLLLPLWFALFFEPIKDNNKIKEKPAKVIKIEKTKVDTTLILKIKN
jgi:hypothetical protein